MPSINLSAIGLIMNSMGVASLIIYNRKIIGTTTHADQSQKGYQWIQYIGWIFLSTGVLLQLLGLISPDGMHISIHFPIKSEFLKVYEKPFWQYLPTWIIAFAGVTTAAGAIIAAVFAFPRKPNIRFFDPIRSDFAR